MADKKTIAIVILSIALLIVSYIAFKTEPIAYDKELIEKRISTLEEENGHLNNDIATERKKTSEFLFKIDSLQTIKPKIITKYVTKTNEIDAASVGNIIDDFKSKFSNSSIK